MTVKTSRLSQHAEWLSLMDLSGPFLTVSVLEHAFPQGLDAVLTPKRQKLKAAYDEWREAVDENDPSLPELHLEWVRLVLTDLLEYDHHSLIRADQWSGELPTVSSADSDARFAPEFIVRSPSSQIPRLFIAVVPPGTDLEAVPRNDTWPASLVERMTLLCRNHDVRIGLLTDGERWMLVNSPTGSTSGHASWYARLWFQEPNTLKSFQSLFDVRRCFGPEDETLESLLEKSLERHEEVTDTLGDQVRQAVEVLVQSLDRADTDRNRDLLGDVEPSELYEAGLTVMMRLVFILSAEERGLMLLGDPVYDTCYAVSTLRGQLAEDADRHGPEVLERRYDAWARLLAVFRGVYGGIDHESLRMPALGGSLFDPDRYPFLEGRARGSRWHETLARPLPIDNRTVLLLLNSLQVLEQRGGALLLSYRALDVEQIGHVYEGLLEHTVARVPDVTLGLQGSSKTKNPNIALAELESAALRGPSAVVELAAELTGRSDSAVSNAISKPVDDMMSTRLLAVCGGDAELVQRINPFASLLRTDAWDDPIVYRAGSFTVTLGTDRRETGTHYTPKSLAEDIVTTTLEPLVYFGPAEGEPRERWTLKSSADILGLKVCDIAMGSGAFLVQTCRYLAAKLVEAWSHEEAAGKAITVDGVALDALGSAEPMPTQVDERLTIARRLVAERCLYGVDVNPMAVELAKLSIWLITLAKGRPFGFLDHNLRSGDSLLGIHRIDQLTELRIKPESGRHQLRIFEQTVEAAVNEAIELRTELRRMRIRDINDVEVMARLDNQARRKLQFAELMASAMIGKALRYIRNPNLIDTAFASLGLMAGTFVNGSKTIGDQIAQQAEADLATDLPKGKPPRSPFHWVLNFPEVFLDQGGGFDAIIGNPPFLGGKKLTGVFGDNYREYLIGIIANGLRGHADLVAYFFLRAATLLKRVGFAGLLASNSIAEGDTKEVGLEQLIANGATIFHAVKSEVWPGAANVATSKVHFSIHVWNGAVTLDGVSVKTISTSLTDRLNWSPMKLAFNKGIGYQGSVILGLGFTLEPDEAKQILAQHPDWEQETLFPYLSGKDLNSSPVHAPSRWAICFWDWTEDECRTYPELFEIVRSRVKPERDKQKRRTYRERWWRFAELQPQIYLKSGRGQHITRQLAHNRKPLSKVLAISTGATKYPEFAFVPNNQIYANSICVILSESSALFACLSSDIHAIWAFEHGSRLHERLRYTHGDIFETFPFPHGVLEDSNRQLSELGQRFFTLRSKYMRESTKGMTEVYNELHDPTNTSAEVCELRELQIDINDTVLKAYGFSNIALDHGFHKVDYLPAGNNTRFTISESARRNILYRLSILNHQRNNLHSVSSSDEIQN